MTPHLSLGICLPPSAALNITQTHTPKFEAENNNLEFGQFDKMYSNDAGVGVDFDKFSLPVPLPLNS